MTKSGLIEAVAAKLPHVAAKDVEAVLNTVLAAITEALDRGERVEVRGFGSFTVRHRRAREGRNPKTGEAIQVPAKRVPFFTAGHELRRRVDEGARRARRGARPVAAEQAGRRDAERRGTALEGM